MWGVDVLWRIEDGRMPQCERSVCTTPEDYTYKPDDYLECCCGGQYVMRGGNRFLIRNRDGSLRPYMRRTFLGFWRVTE